MKESKSRFSEELLNEISDLKVRASKIGYKNQMPKLPESGLNFDESLAGFKYRLDNWKKQLLQLENPGGMFSGKKRTELSDGISQIVMKYSGKDDFFDDSSEED